MRLLITTSLSRGLASLAIPRLIEIPGVEIALVLLDEGGPSRPQWGRKLRKALRIGPLGALNGIRMRRWYLEDVQALLRLDSLEAVCHRHGLPHERVPGINSGRARELVAQTSADLGLSLGGGYIGSRTFSLPRWGMINVHHEVLPDFRGAQSVIWQIYHGSRETGYTIHQIDRSIDTGKILYQQRLPIDFRRTLGETVTHNYAGLWQASVGGLVEVVRGYPDLAARASAQGPGRSFTTPTIWQYWRMVRRHRQLFR